MAPISLSWLASSPTAQLLTRQDDNPAVSATPVAAYLAAQWRNPNDILSVLMLLGPDVIKSAIAQLAGRAITPVAFSFGWVAYAPIALLSSFGGAELPIKFESTLLVVEPKSGHSRHTSNWILGRLWRDFNDRLDDQMKNELPHGVSPGAVHAENQRSRACVRKWRKHGQGHKPPFEALRVAVFELEDEESLREQGVPVLDFVWFMGIFIIAVQLGIATIPWAVNGQWDVFLVTAAGNLFAVINLLGIGLLGSMQNLVAASIRRSPAALGIHMKEIQAIKGRRVAEVSRQVEEQYPLLGTALIDVFFPGSMRIKKENAEEVAFWSDALEARYKENKHGIRLDRLPAEDKTEKEKRSGD
ncbi:hypothetical protein VP1G_09617 [Cytospora mali]|uniref:Uncharacterized protein n=1 Tax=Cytospora mali TaxID=578113 RepID=A0A194VFD8_CYTMA|nr:hypothetical protein VP1G_09617 [Valsa mali var. pyri (nom. inval.)]